MFFKYWKMLMLFFAVPVIVFIAIFSKYYISYRTNEFNQMFITSAYKSKTDFSVIANNCDNLYTTVMNDADTLNFLNQSSPEPDSIDSYELFTNILKQYQSFKIANSYIDSISLYSSNSDYILSTAASNYRKNLKESGIVDRLINDKKTRTFVSSEIDENGEIKNIITLAYDLCINSYDNPDGILIININCDNLASSISSNYIHEDVFLFSENGSILNSHPNISKKEISKFINIYRANKEQIEKSYYLQKVDNGALCYTPISQLKITMALYVQSKNYNNILLSTAVTLIAFVILTLIVILVISLYTSLNIYKNIANVISVIGCSPMPGEKQANEINFISDSFLSVLKNVSDVENELSDKVLLLQKSQMLALQTQINPHFIFNTLNLVNLMIIRITQENCAPARIITLLSDILYYSFKTDGFITTVEEELSYTKKYIQIEQIKYNNKFNFEFEVPETLKNLKIIKFMFQPIIENCIEHGIKGLSDNEGFIKLKAYKENSFLKFAISDNGAGMSQDKLQEINQRLESSDISVGKHIGLANVHQRIQLLFGKEYGIKIIPLIKGTMIDITLPLKP